MERIKIGRMEWWKNGRMRWGEWEKGREGEKKMEDWMEELRNCGIDGF